MSRPMLTNLEIESIKQQIRAELRQEFHEMISRQVTGGIGRAIKKIERQQQQGTLKQ